jgi:hypothetical protein
MFDGAGVEFDYGNAVRLWATLITNGRTNNYHITFFRTKAECEKADGTWAD